MSITVRSYRPGNDFERIGQFLVELYESSDVLRAWLQPRWEYMHFHPNIDDLDRSSFGVAEDERDQVTGIIHPEDSPAFIHYQARWDVPEVRPALLAWATERFGGYSSVFDREVIGLYLHHGDTEMQQLLRRRGFRPSPDHGEAHARLRLDRELREHPLPPGFRLAGLDQENDLSEVNRVLWRGFGHPGPAPEELVSARHRAQQAPSFRPDLNVVAIGPDGHYASYAGVWLVEESQVAYVEPVATDPDHRRLGVGSATVLEALRRVRDLGATVAWVGSDQPFYGTLGFDVVAHSPLWVRESNGPQPSSHR